MGGKRKGKKKFRNAEEARKARELAAEWERNQSNWSKLSPKVTTPKRQSLEYKLSVPAGRTTSNNIPSRVTEGGSTAPVHKVYTGDKIIGIATLHKSNAVPVFAKEDAVEISRMRRG
jgi:hypothetical protein